MKIGIVGGTGGMGEGLALRWSLNHDVIVGSRDAQRAVDSAASYSKLVSEAYGSQMKGSINGMGNVDLARECELLVLSIPYEHTEGTCSQLAGVIRRDCIVVCPIVPMRKGPSGFEYIPFHDAGAAGGGGEEEKKTTSAAEKVANRMPDRSRIVSTLHTISEVKLKHVNESLDGDAFLCGDDPSTVKIVSDLVREVKGLRPIYLGPLSISYLAEMMTPMLLNAAKQNKIKNPALKII